MQRFVAKIAIAGIAAAGLLGGLASPAFADEHEVEYDLAAGGSVNETKPTGFVSLEGRSAAHAEHEDEIDFLGLHWEVEQKTAAAAAR